MFYRTVYDRKIKNEKTTSKALTSFSRKFTSICFFLLLTVVCLFWNKSKTSSWFQRRRWHPTPVLLRGQSHGRRSLEGCSPWGREESDTTEWLCFHFSLSCIGEGNGNPLQCSCLENPRDRGAWWAAVYGVAQSWTRLKWLSSNSILKSPMCQSYN